MKLTRDQQKTLEALSAQAAGARDVAMHALQLVGDSNKRLMDFAQKLAGGKRCMVHHHPVTRIEILEDAMHDKTTDG